MFSTRADSSDELASLLFPDLVQRVDAALAEYGASEDSDDTFEADLAASVDRLRESVLGSAILDVFGPSSRVPAGFDNARRIAESAGLAAPAPEAWIAAGVNGAAFQQALAADGTLALVPAPAGLGAERWRQLFRAAARRQNSPLSLAEPVVFAEEVLQSFDALDRPPAGVPTVRIGDVPWTLRLVPASSAPPVLGMSHFHGPHVTLPEMLMLQLMRLHAGEDPLDARSFTWLDGVLADGRFAARHIFDAGERSVRVTSREVGNQGPHLGARPPIG